MTDLPSKDRTSPPWVCSPELELELEPMILTSTFSKILIIYLKQKRTKRPDLYNRREGGDLTYITYKITNSTYSYVWSHLILWYFTLRVLILSTTLFEAPERKLENFEMTLGRFFFFNNAFLIGLELESFSNRSDSILSGVSTLNSQIYFTGTIASAHRPRQATLP